MEWNKLNFEVPVTQGLNSKGEFIIEGTAINAGTTRNGTIFIEEELRKSAKSLRNKPVLKDHANSVDSIVGRTTNKVSYNENEKKIDFQAFIVDEKAKSLISQGLLNTVSVGAMVDDYEEHDDGNYTIHGIDFVELSLTPVPADKGATFGMAIAESIKKKNEFNKKVELHNDSHLIKVKEENSKMDNDTKVLEELKTLRTEKKTREEVESRALLKEELKAEILEEIKVTEEAEPTEEIVEEVEAEPEAEPETEPEAEPEKETVEEEVEEEAVEVEEKMKGKVNNEVEEVNEEINDLVITTEGVTSGYAIFQENIDKVRFKR